LQSQDLKDAHNFKVAELREAMAELLAAYESTTLREPDADIASASTVYVPAAVRRRLLLIGQLKQLVEDNGPTGLILKQVRHLC